MSKPIPAALRVPVTDIASGKAWLRALVAADMAFHLEDNPAEIIMHQTGKYLFQRRDIPIIRKAVAALYDLTWGPDPMYYCPIGFMMSVEPFNEENQAKGFEAGAEFEYREGMIVVIDRAHCASYEYGSPGRYQLFIDWKPSGNFNTVKEWERALA